MASRKCSTNELTDFNLILHASVTRQAPRSMITTMMLPIRSLTYISDYLVLGFKLRQLCERYTRLIGANDSSHFQLKML